MEQARLAELVAAKMCHDFLGPITALTQGLDLLKQGSAEREEAVSLLEAGVAKAQAKFDFYRHALAGALGAEGELRLSSGRAAAERVFATLKPQLVWAETDVALPRAALRVVLNMLIIASDCLARGGQVTLEADAGEIRVVATGEKTRLRTEVSDGLRGEMPDNELQSIYIQPFLTGLLARQAGVELVARESDGRIELAMKSAQFRLP